MNSNQEVQFALIDKRHDHYMSEAGWLNQDPSEKILALTDGIKVNMLMSMWYEYLAFTEGIATEVYDTTIEDFLEDLGSLKLLDGFLAYVQGAIEAIEDMAE